LAEKAASVDPGATSALRDTEQTAEQGSQAGASPKQAVEAAGEVQSNLQRAAADIAARQQQVRRDQEAAQAIADAALRQQAARDAIAELGEALLKASAVAAVAPSPSSPDETAIGQGSPTAADGQAPPPTPTAAQVSAAQGLTQARQQFAEAQWTLGQGAVEVSGQEQVVNPPIREALDTASQLAEATPGGELAASGEQNASGGENAAGQGDSAEPGETASSGAEQGMGQGQEEGQGMGEGQGQSQGMGQGMAAGQGRSPSGQLGTGFVPNAPEVTAEMIAGAEANAQAAAICTQPGGGGQPRANPAGAATAQGKGGGTSVDGEATENQSAGDNPLERLDGPGGADSRTADANADAAAGGEDEFEAPPWFAKLPKRQQDAIRADALRRAPRGYEERLKRYFQSVD
jgi:hypothetical protein